MTLGILTVMSGIYRNEFARGNYRTSGVWDWYLGLLVQSSGAWGSEFIEALNYPSICTLKRKRVWVQVYEEKDAHTLYLGSRDSFPAPDNEHFS